MLTIFAISSGVVVHFPEWERSLLSENWEIQNSLPLRRWFSKDLSIIWQHFKIVKTNLEKKYESTIDILGKIRGASALLQHWLSTKLNFPFRFNIVIQYKIIILNIFE